jgi:dipeptidyl aminopeptidase/acylaminoacyl peptidase
VYRASFSPSGTRIVTASLDRTARIWDATTGAELVTLSGHSGAVYDAQFSPDGQAVVTASADRTARVWDVTMRTQPRVLAGHEGAVAAAAFDATGRRVVTGDVAGITGVWDVDTGENLGFLQRHQEFVNTARFSPDGDRILTASDDGTARIYGCATCGDLEDLVKLAKDTQQRLPDLLAGQRVSARADRSDRQVGDCFDSGNKPIDCAKPHESELFAVVQYPSRSDMRYVQDTVAEYGETACAGSAFEDYVGRASSGSRYKAAPSSPDKRDWEQGYREIYCYLSIPDEQITGSARGSGK